MQRRHFEMIAETIRNTRGMGDISNDLVHWRPGPHKVIIANALADRFARENTRFDHSRFLKACGVEE